MRKLICFILFCCLCPYIYGAELVEEADERGFFMIHQSIPPKDPTHGYIKKKKRTRRSSEEGLVFAPELSVELHIDPDVIMKPEMNMKPDLQMNPGLKMIPEVNIIPTTDIDMLPELRLTEQLKSENGSEGELKETSKRDYVLNPSFQKIAEKNEEHTFPTLKDYYSSSELELFSDESRVDRAVSLSNNWRYCPGFKADAFDLQGIDVVPNPPIAGQIATFTVRGVVKQEMSPLLKTTFQLRRFTINQVFDHCKDYTCPVQPGDFSVDLEYQLAKYINGTAHGVATLIDKMTKKTILCVKIGPLTVLR